MTGTGNEGIDSAREEGILWIREVAEELHLRDPEDAYRALRAVLHALRDRLSEEQAVNLDGQLPLRVRRVYFEGWPPLNYPPDEPPLDQFLTRVTEELREGGQQDPQRISQGVIRVMQRHLPAEDIEEIKRSLPVELRALWPEG